MQKSFSIGFPEEKHIPALKKLWQTVFSDSEKVINNFFENTAEYENIICAFHNEEPVSVLYAVDSAVNVNSVQYRAYYIYALCTKKEYTGNRLSQETLKFLEKIAKKRGVSYLFLVPAEDSLFALYEKSGFKTGFSYTQSQVSYFGYDCSDLCVSELQFQEYKKIRQKNLPVTYTTFANNGFNSFYHFAESNMNCFCVDNESYGLYEIENGEVTVHECIGDSRKVLSYIFSQTKCSSVTVRSFSLEGGKPYGMYKVLDSSPGIENGFIGISYGG